MPDDVFSCMSVGGRGCAVVHVPLLDTDDLARAERLLSAGHGVVVTLDSHSRPDVAALGALARLALTARRSGAQLVVQAPDAALREVAELLGLDDVLGLRADPVGPDVEPGTGPGRAPDQLSAPASGEA